jgi:tripartite-type tricarboxylate transporter receptor subunit TctC
MNPFLRAPLALLLAAFAAGALAQAGAYPSRPIRLIAPHAPGGTVDIMARQIAPRLAEAWNQQVVIENRVGASGTIGSELVARSAPDGYTALINASIFAITPHVLKLNYDVVRDFAHVVHLYNVPNVFTVHAGVAAQDVKGFVALAKKEKLSYATAGAGSAAHLAAEYFKRLAGIADFPHIPYKGSGQALVDVIAGQVPAMFDSMTSSLPHIRGGKLRALAVTSPQRSPLLPDVQSFAEAGFPGLTGVGSWYGIWLPAGTPQPIVAKWHAEVTRILALPDLRERIRDQAGEPQPMNSDQFADWMKAEVARWADLVRLSGARNE